MSTEAWHKLSTDAVAVLSPRSMRWNSPQSTWAWAPGGVSTRRNGRRRGLG
jgi:hypothetical protein